jgi:hypothetical protein
MTALSLNGDGRDISLYSIWALRDALEDIDPKEKLSNKSMLQAATMWMIYAAPQLRDQARENRSFEGKKAREGETLIGKGWSGFSMDRWKLWEERFIQLRDKCEDESTKDLLAMAISRM